MSTLLLAILTFLVYLLAQALFINGVYISAKGSDEKLPDGTVLESEMILYPLYKYLNQSTVQRIPFTYTVVKERFKGLYPTIPGARLLWDIKMPDNSFPLKVSDPAIFDIRPFAIWAEAYLSAKIFYDASTSTVLIYQDVTVYRFSKYLRKPIITCVICMASFWSIFLFLIPALIIFGVLAKIFLIWIANVFCLSYLNYLIFKNRK